MSAVQAAGRKSEQYTPDATWFSRCTLSGVSTKVIGHGGRVSPKLGIPARQWQRPDCISLPRRSDCPGNGVWGGGSTRTQLALIIFVTARETDSRHNGRGLTSCLVTSSVTLFPRSVCVFGGGRGSGLSDSGVGERGAGGWGQNLTNRLPMCKTANRKCRSPVDR